MQSDEVSTAARRVVRARAMGPCFGVLDALSATDEIEQPDRVTILGELVHNPEVVADLAERGFQSQPEHLRGGPVETEQVLLTAHGVSDRERARLRKDGHELIDTTCPLVRKAHDRALELAEEGRHVIVVGRRGHVEVRGLVGDLPHFDVAESPAEVARYPWPRLGVVAQTTTPPDHFDAVVAAIRERNPDADLRVLDTVCAPTRDRQLAVDELAAAVRVAVVVGGAGSNNTGQLVARLARQGVVVHRVSEPGEVDPQWFAGETVVGLTAGTSALPATIDAVERAIVEAEA